MVIGCCCVPGQAGRCILLTFTGPYTERKTCPSHPQWRNQRIFLTTALLSPSLTQNGLLSFNRLLFRSPPEIKKGNAIPCIYCLICPLNPLASHRSHIGRNPAGSDGVRGCESDLTSGQLTSPQLKIMKMALLYVSLLSLLRYAHLEHRKCD